MRDFPIFTTEYGVSSLFLKEIPYKNIAYIRIRDISEENFGDHMKECVSFCRMVGAERIFAADHPRLENYPLSAAVYEMRGCVPPDPKKTACLFPVTERTVGRWRTHYNEAMKHVDHAQTLESRDEAKILERGGAYFVHREGDLLGIGWVEDGTLLAVAAIQKGAGETVLRTLVTLAKDNRLRLEVVSTNRRAIRLYEKLGFFKTAELTRWYDVGGTGTPEK